MPKFQTPSPHNTLIQAKIEPDIIASYSIISPAMKRTVVVIPSSRLLARDWKRFQECKSAGKRSFFRHFIVERIQSIGGAVHVVIFIREARASMPEGE